MGAAAGLSGLRAFLGRHRLLALDTSVFIYQLEANPRYAALTHPIFTALERPGLRAVTSTITLTELLVQPYRTREQGGLRVDEIYALLTTFPRLDWIAPGLEVADLAARMRALYRLRTPDALQAATAAHARATALITNDPVFARAPDFETLVLDRLL